jgi:hypothetical protein
MSGTYSNAPCIEEGYKKIHYTSNSWGIFSEFTFSLDKNPNNGYKGFGIL